MFNNNYTSHIPHFWSLQIIYWGGLSIITFLSLTLWYGNVGWMHVSHTLLQGVMGLILSLPLHYVFSMLWEAPQLLRVFLSLLMVAFIASIWTLLRMLTFIWITDEDNLWSDFGGWYFAAMYVFLCWTALYHGIRYFQLLQLEHQKKVEAEAAISDELLKRLIAEKEAKDAQLKMLRYQLNPHFLFNTLNAINSLVSTKATERAQKIIVQLSQFLRYSLDNNPEMKIPLEREISALLLYLEIEKTRFADRLQLDFDIADDAKDALVPSLLLQPLVENSMKYAIAKSERGGIIRLRCYLDDEQLVLELSDSGTGSKLQSSKVKSADGRGIGLRNTVDRLKAFYTKDYSFDLSTSSLGGLQTTIRLPYQILEIK